MSEPNHTEAANSGKSPRRRVVWLLGTLIGLPILGILGVASYVSWCEGQADSALASLVQDGIVRDPAAVWAEPELTSTDANQAFRRALEILDTEQILWGDDPEGAKARLEADVLSGAEPRRREGEAAADPDSVDGKREATTELEACRVGALLTLGEWKGRRLPDEVLPARVAELLDSLFARLQQAEPHLDQALKADELVFENLALGAPNGVDHIDVRHLQTALRTRSVRSAVSGDLEQGWEDLSRHFRLVRVLRSGYGMWKRGAIRDGLAILELLLPQGLPSQERLAKIRADLSAMEDPSLMQRATVDEFLWGLAVLDALLGDKAAEGWLSARGYTMDEAPGLLGFPVRHDRAAYVSWYARELRYLGASSLAEAKRLSPPLEERPSTWSPFGPALLGPHFSLLGIQRDFEDRAQLRLALVALDLAAKGGDLPETLPTPPADPCSPDQAVRWRRDTGRSGLLWSVGADGEDHGGARPGEPVATWEWESGADVVFRLTLPD